MSAMTADEVALSPALKIIQTEVLLVDVDEVALLLGVSVRTVFRLLRRADFPQPMRLSRKNIRWRLSDIKEWIDDFPIRERSDLTPKGVVRYLDQRWGTTVSLTTVYRWISEGILPARSVTGTGRYLINRADLEAFADLPEVVPTHA